MATTRLPNRVGCSCASPSAGQGALPDGVLGPSAGPDAALQNGWLLQRKSQCSSSSSVAGGIAGTRRAQFCCRRPILPICSVYSRALRNGCAQCGSGEGRPRAIIGSDGHGRAHFASCAGVAVGEGDGSTHTPRTVCGSTRGEGEGRRGRAQTRWPFSQRSGDRSERGHRRRPRLPRSVTRWPACYASRVSGRIAGRWLGPRGSRTKQRPRTHG